MVVVIVGMVDVGKKKPKYFRAVICFKSINSRGEIDLFLFKDKDLFEMVEEFLEQRYTLTILHFDKLDPEDESNFEYIETLDDANIDWHRP